MFNETTLFRKRFHKSLEPFKIMLASRRSEMSEQEWLAFVEKTKESALGHPDQHLGQELPPPETLRLIVQNIFNELINRMR